MSDETRLNEVQAYYDNLAPRLVAVEKRNWHLQSRMAIILETIDHHATPGGRVPGAARGEDAPPVGQDEGAGPHGHLSAER